MGFADLSSIMRQNEQLHILSYNTTSASKSWKGRKARKGAFQPQTLCCRWRVENMEKLENFDMRKQNDRIEKLEKENKELWQMLWELQQAVARLRQEIRKRGEG